MRLAELVFLTLLHARCACEPSMLRTTPTTEEIMDLRYRPELAECASDAAFAIGTDMRVLAWNAHAERILGYSKAEVLGRRCADVLRAVLIDGKPLCSSDCAFGRCSQPFSVPACAVQRRDGQWMSLELSTLFLTATAVRQTRPPAARILVFLRPRAEIATAVTPDPRLRIFTLGRFKLVFQSRELNVTEWTRKHSVQLLKLLASRPGRPLHRAVLIDHLWPNATEQRGRERLKVAVHYLRRRLTAAGIRDEVVATEGESYCLRRDVAWVDAPAFEQLALCSMRLSQLQDYGGALRNFEQTLGLYAGDYLEDEIRADWCEEERERLRELCLEVIAGTAAIHARQGRFEEAVRLCRRGLVMEPCRETLHRALMLYLHQIGRRSSALRQYRRCCALLAREFGVDPLPTTQALYQRILRLDPPSS